MATLYAKAAGGNWSAAGTWSATGSGGVDSAGPPTSADNVILELGSGNVTIDAAAACRSLDTTSGTGTYGGTLTHTIAITLTIGDGTAGAGNVALKLNSGMTYSRGGTNSAITFASTNATQQTVTYGNQASIGNQTWNGVGGSWIIQDTLNAGGATLDLTNGTLNTNGQTISTAIFQSSNSNTRSLTFGASSITLSSTGNAFLFNPSNCTLSAGSSTITLTGAGALFNINGTATTWGTLVLSGSGQQRISLQSNGSGTFSNITRTGTNVTTDGFLIDSNLTITITGTLTLNSNSAINRLLVYGGTVGTKVTVNAASLVCTNIVDFEDVTAGGAATWTTAASGATAFGDCGGNTGITFTTPVAQTWNGTAGGNWSANAWTTRVPLPQDNVTLSSAFASSPTITVNMPRSGANVDWSASTGTVTWDRGSGVTPTFYGNLTMRSGITWGTIFTGAWTFAGRGAQTFTSAGINITYPIVFQPIGGSYTLQDDLTITATGGGLTTATGTFNANNRNIVALSWSTSGAGCIINMGTGTWVLSTTTVSTMVSLSSTATVNTSTSKIIITGASGNNKTFAGGNHTFNQVVYDVPSSPAPLIITGTNTFNSLTIGPGRILTLPSATTTTVPRFTAFGVPNRYIYLSGTSGNYFSAPDSVPLSITGDIDIRVRVAFDDWTPVGANAILSKYTGTASTSSYMFYLDPSSTGKLRLYQSDGVTITQGVSSVAPTVVDGSPLWVRVTRAQSTGQTQFFTADGTIANPTASDFTQLGTNVTVASGAATADTATQLEIGSWGSGAQAIAVGKFYRAQVRNGIDGTLAFDSDFTAKAIGTNTFTESSANAATVTINGSLAQAGDGRVLINASTPASAATMAKTTGTTIGNYLTIQDSTVTGGAWYAGANSVSISNNTGWIFTANPKRIPADITIRTVATNRTVAATRTVATTRTLVS